MKILARAGKLSLKLGLFVVLILVGGFLLQTAGPSSVTGTAGSPLARGGQQGGPAQSAAIDPTTDPAALTQAIIQGGVVQPVSQGVNTSYLQLEQAYTDGEQQQFFALQAKTTYNQPVVKALQQNSVDIASAALALMILLSAYSVMRGAVELADLLPRLALVAVAIYGCGQLLPLFIQLDNAVSGSIFAAAHIDPTRDLLQILGVPTFNVGSPISSLVSDIVIGIMGVIVLLQQIVEMAIIDLFFAFFPLICLLFLWGETQQLGALCVYGFFIVLAIKVVQVGAIVLGGLLLGAGVTTLDLLAFIEGIAILWLVLKIPGWLGVLGSAIAGVPGVGSVIGDAYAQGWQRLQSAASMARLFV